MIHQTFSLAEIQFSLYIKKKKSQSALRLHESGKHSSNLVDRWLWQSAGSRTYMIPECVTVCVGEGGYEGMFFLT